MTRILGVVVVLMVLQSPLLLVTVAAKKNRPVLRMTGMDAVVTGRSATFPQSSGTLLLEPHFSLDVPELELVTPEHDDGALVVHRQQLYSSDHHQTFLGSGIDAKGHPVSVSIVATSDGTTTSSNNNNNNNNNTACLNGYVLYRDTHYTIRGSLNDHQGQQQQIRVERQSARDYPDEETAILEEEDRRHLRETTTTTTTTSLVRPRRRQLRLDPSTGLPIVTALIVFPRDIGCSIATFGRATDCDTTTPLVHTMLEGTARLVVNLANMAYKNSDIALRMELAGFRVMDDVEMNYAASMRQLNEFKFGRKFLQLRRERDTLDADFVSLISDFPGSCGLAFIAGGLSLQTGDQAYSLINYRCIPNHSFTHEVAHTMGCLHNAENTPFSGGYSYGYRSPEHGFRSIMAYNCAADEYCPRIAHFSNPNVTYNGFPTGSDHANNARWINQHHWLYTTYRQECEEESWMGLFCEIYRLIRHFLDFLTSQFWE